jgi:hypothetical protein
VRIAPRLEPGAKLFALIRCATTAEPDVSVPRVAVRGEVVRGEPQPDGRWGLDVRFTRYRFLEGAPVLGPPGRGPGAVCRPPERTRDMSSREVDRINRVQGPIQAACTLLMPHKYSRRPPSRTWGRHCAWDTACYGVGMTVATPHPPVSPVWDAGAGACRRGRGGMHRGAPGGPGGPELLPCCLPRRRKHHGWRPRARERGGHTYTVENSN